MATIRTAHGRIFFSEMKYVFLTHVELEINLIVSTAGAQVVITARGIQSSFTTGCPKKSQQ